MSDKKIPDKVNQTPPNRENTSEITQANIIPSSKKSTDVINRTTFSTSSVKKFTSSDFNLDTKEMISIKDESCTLILFFVENEESQQLVSIWSTVAQQVAGPIFGAINMLYENKVAEAFVKIKGVNAHPLHSFSLKSYPFILVYRNGWPAAFYNGARNVASIIDYSLTLACSISYNEPYNISGGMQSESPVEMGSYGLYPNNNELTPKPLRTSSIEYQSEDHLREFNPNLGIVKEGSKESIKADEIENRKRLENVKNNIEEKKQAKVVNPK